MADTERHDSNLHITIDGMDQVIGLLKGNSQALNAILIGEQAIMDAISKINSGDPAATVKAITDLNSAKDSLKAKTDSLQAAIPKTS